MLKKSRRTSAARPFLLLELLLAIALTALLLGPLVKPQGIVQKLSKEYLLEYDFARLAELSFVDLQAALYENRLHSWKALKSGTVEGALSLPNSIMAHYTLNPIGYTSKYSLNSDYLLLETLISFEESPKSSYPFHLLIRRNRS